MEYASQSDLKTASNQGTILSIYYNDNTWYGSGSVATQQTSNHYRSTQGSSNHYGSTVASGCGIVFLLTGVLLIGRRFLLTRTLPASFRKNLVDPGPCPQVNKTQKDIAVPPKDIAAAPIILF